MYFYLILIILIQIYLNHINGTQTGTATPDQSGFQKNSNTNSFVWNLNQVTRSIYDNNNHYATMPQSNKLKLI